SCQLFCATGKGVAVIDPAEMARWDRERHVELQRELYQAAARAEGFAYLGARLTEAWKNGAPDTALGSFHNALISPAMMAAIRATTGASPFDSASAQAPSYRRGHSLPRHLDDPKGEHRRFAFVWGFTRKWDPDWGGLLQFFGNDGLPRDALSPD